jgi:hypothetical protein
VYHVGEQVVADDAKNEEEKQNETANVDDCWHDDY